MFSANPFSEGNSDVAILALLPAVCCGKDSLYLCLQPFQKENKISFKLSAKDFAGSLKEKNFLLLVSNLFYNILNSHHSVSAPGYLSFGINFFFFSVKKSLKYNFAIWSAYHKNYN